MTTSFLNRAKVDKNRILLLWDGSNAGEFILSRKGILSSTMAVLNLYNIRRNYLWYYLKNFEPQLKKFTIGMGVPHVNGEELRNGFVTLPPKLEQTAIATYLDRKTAEIDELIADKKRLLELYAEEKTAIINQAVTKGLDPNVPMKDSSIEWLGEIPAHWEVKKLKYVASIVLGKMLTSNNNGGCFLKPYLRSANLDWFNVKVDDVKKMWFSEKELKKYRLKKNDLLVSEGGEVGRTCIWRKEIDECYIQNSVHKVTVNYNCEPFYFLQQFYMFGKNGAFDLIVNRISIAHLTVEKLREIKFVVPPLEEQQSIVKHIESECNRIDLQVERTKSLIELLNEYREALISEVVTGKVKVI
jgi:type I restriction enzyme, S subunit